MRYLNLTLATPALNLAADEALLDAAEAGGEGELLRFWEPSELFVVVGYANRISTEANWEACLKQGIPILRRCSGGGAVLQGPGCLNYSLILRAEASGPLGTITGANAFIMERQRAALSALLQQPVSIRGHTDLALGALKFSGNAQRRKRQFLIFHGAFLLNFDLSLMETLLPMPSQQPDYRENRSHTAFLTNLHIDAAAVKAALRAAWQAHEPVQEVPMAQVQKLVSEKYGRAEWNQKY